MGRVDRLTTAEWKELTERVLGQVTITEPSGRTYRRSKAENAAKLLLSRAVLKYTRLSNAGKLAENGTFQDRCRELIAVLKTFPPERPARSAP